MQKKSKCVFSCIEIEYLGHIILANNIKADKKKIAAMQLWPTPTTIKALKGFLGFT